MTKGRDGAMVGLRKLRALVWKDHGRIQNDTCGTKLSAIRKPRLSKFHSMSAQCFCQQMSRNSRATIAGSRRLYHKACIRLSKCACGKTDGDAASPNKKYSKIPCGDSQTAQLSSQRPRVAEGSYPENETTEKNDYDNGRRRGGGGPTKN